MDNTQLWCMIRIQSDRNISWREYIPCSHNHDATFEEAFFIFIFSFLYDTYDCTVCNKLGKKNEFNKLLKRSYPLFEVNTWFFKKMIDWTNWKAYPKEIHVTSSKRPRKGKNPIIYCSVLIFKVSKRDWNSLKDFHSIHLSFNRTP